MAGPRQQVRDRRIGVPCRVGLDICSVGNGGERKKGRRAEGERKRGGETEADSSRGRQKKKSQAVSRKENLPA